jgi:hypothetical protein
MVTLVPQPFTDDYSATGRLDAAALTSLQTHVHDAAVASVTANLKFNAAGYGSIQAAVDAAAAVWGTVEIPAGTWTLSAPVTIPDFVSIEGHGRGTRVQCNGNFYAFSFAPGNHSRLSHLYIDAASAQATGGAIDFANAGSNTQADHIWFGPNLNTSVRITPVGSGGLFEFDHLRFLVGGGRNIGIQIGDGTHNVPNVFINDVMGLVASNADINLWLDIRNNVDTLHFTNAIFFKGTKGARVGDDTATGALTNSKFGRVVFDSMAQEGWHFRKSYLTDVTACGAQGCGSTTLPGVRFGPAVQALTMEGGNIHECVKDGAWIESGAKGVKLLGVNIANNNTSNTAFGAGLSVLANASDWDAIGCKLGNGMYDDGGVSVQAGHQKYGILIAGGTSSNFGIIDNRFVGNETAPYLNAGTGANQVIRGNAPEVIPSIASAATVALPGGPIVEVTGTTSITNITADAAGRIVIVKFTGALTLTDGGNLKLGGNFTTSADDAILIFCDGTNWYQVAPGSAN